MKLKQDVIGPHKYSRNKSLARHSSAPANPDRKAAVNADFATFMT
jgi:hypothetical protein